MELVTGVDRPQTPRAQFADFVTAHGDRLLHTAYGLCGDWQHAEDLVQQVLLTMARRWDRITTSPAAYAYRCLVRANIDRWRVVRRHPEFSADPTVLARMQPEDGTRPTAAVDDRLALLDVLAALPPRQRAIVVLRYLQDLSESDTAAALGISVGAVKSGAARALARLRTAATTPSQEAGA
jgi:RNA polymerase sigma-70 factor (sigma-E family)